MVDFGFAGAVIGEIMMIIALAAIVWEVGPPSLWTRALIVIHGLLVLAGIEIVLAGGLGSASWSFAFGVMNWVEFAVLGAAVALVSARTTRAALWNLATPFLVAAAVTAVAMWGGAGADIEPWVRALRYLGLHYYVVAGALILSLFLHPPPHAEASKLTLYERIGSGMGRFWIVLQLVWWSQLALVISERGRMIIDGGAVHVIVAVAALSFGVWRALSRGRRLLDTLPA